MEVYPLWLFIYHTLKEYILFLLQNDITRQYPKAAGFTLKSFIFAKDWNKTVATSGSDIVQYLRRTPALYTRQKNILIPGRVQPKSLDTHEFEPETGYER
jgi:hypothetical protein